MFKSDPYYAKQDLKAKLVVILDGLFPKRGLQLIPQPSRAICRDHIHELIITDQDAGPGDTVDRIAYMGFAEFIQGGVMVVGDQVTVDGHLVGTVAGFDETHMPNHWNIVLKGELRTGSQRELLLSQQVVFSKSKQTT